ncbi:MerR family transcriptional regulator [Desulforhopalus singaporensis]|uniref:DNA-binding transcriptional regulator, MerR family n=1 Tax=Desulforhopalus singaporensis TaxID=91360 RepID=A0A1H0L596_9BACT|nr:MerR family transcriptional regulator [Desulforhopalus singaporensis]SDO63444.1 DNA-binding transcriptional regulator, MerR family [Desulforhopalus singaporensis]
MAKTGHKPIQIGELAKSLNITTRTIRYYEEIGLMGKSDRLGGSTRSYSDDDVLRLKFILKLKAMGVPLKDMQELSNLFDINQKNFNTITPKLIKILDTHIAQIDEKMANLSSLRKDIVNYRVRITDFLATNGKPESKIQ